MSELLVLLEELRRGRQALGKIEDYLAGQEDAPRTDEKAIVLADVLGKYYTCLETLFLRISQLFENSLAADRWHSDLLEKMSLRIEGVREPVLREETQRLLGELLKFRHFTRYYYDISYDWDRLDYVARKYAQARPLLHEDLDRFESFLQALRHAEPPGE